MGGDKRGEGNGRDGRGRDGKIGNDGEGRDEREGKERDGKVTYPHSRVELLIVAWIRSASAAASVRLHVAVYNSNLSAAFDHSSRSCRLGGLEIGACSVSKQFRPRLHRDCIMKAKIIVTLYINKKAVLPQGNRAMPQVFFSVEVRQQHSLQV